MTHRTLILVIRRLSERARAAKDEKECSLHLFDRYGDPWYYRNSREAKGIELACRAKIDQLTERYS